MATNSAPIKRAIVRQLRSSSSLAAAIAGGIHEGVAPRKVKYPFITYQLVSAPHDYGWGYKMLNVMIDVSTYATNPVDANNIDALISEALDEADLLVDEQTTLLCRRVADLPTGPDIDSEGKRIYQVGGSYLVITDQPL